MTSEEKQREEAKRDRMYDPALRWKHIQEMITWAEANMPEHLRRNRPRVHKSLAKN
jgi:ActR/RegA family two-component response regulator